jgi:hypothetical protein
MKVLSFALSLLPRLGAAVAVLVGLVLIVGREFVLAGGMRLYWANAAATKQRQNSTIPNGEMILNLFFVNIAGLKDAASAFEIRMVARARM